MGRNYYLNNGCEYRSCHVGKLNSLDVIDICRYFGQELSSIDKNKYKIYRKYLKMVSEAIWNKRHNDQSTSVQCVVFTNLPLVLVEIFNILKTNGRELKLVDDYDDDSNYDFEHHILIHCKNNGQGDLGGLNYSIYTDYR